MLQFVPTPIGNLRDITLRSLDALRGASLVLCEDTRQAKRLYMLLVQKEILQDCSLEGRDFYSFHSHTKEEKLQNLIPLLKEKDCIYLSDAGMPSISDPGSEIVRFCLKNEIEIDFLPGSNAALLAFGLSGFGDKEFLFYGFLPHKRTQRLKELEDILEFPYPTILYEAPTRLLQLLEEIRYFDKSIELFLVKELTKMYQKTYRGSVEEIEERVQDSSIKGEWCVVIKPKKRESMKIGIEEIIALNLPPKISSKILAKIYNKSTKEIYDEMVSKHKISQ